ncbi:hypothetical protein BVI1335_540029 [Burkholderia vietnamiensis]|nr:hypothetical protein BVI1335_540029 [Burkholderia vietnamiensis]
MRAARARVAPSMALIIRRAGSRSHGQCDAISQQLFGRFVCTLRFIGTVMPRPIRCN